MERRDDQRAEICSSFNNYMTVALDVTFTVLAKLFFSCSQFQVPAHDLDNLLTEVLF